MQYEEKVGVLINKAVGKKCPRSLCNDAGLKAEKTLESTKRFSFAGLLMASECFCGAYFNDDSKVKDEECQLPCQGDRQRSCGGQKYIAIYSTA